MLQPKRSKFKKNQKSRDKTEILLTNQRLTRAVRLRRRIENNQPIQSRGRYKIISLSIKRLRAATIEAVRRVITRKLKRTGRVFVCVHPSLSVTEKPLEVRMGKGKGAVSYWICRVKKGGVLYEIDGVDFSKAKSAWLLANAKLPIKTKICT